MSLLLVEDLGVCFDTPAGALRALDGVSFEVGPGEVVGLVGESGSGKSLACLALLGLVPRPGRIDRGRALFRGEDLLRLSPARARARRGKEIAMVFQDPGSALNPLLPVGLQLSEVLEVHEGLPRRAARKRAAAALAEVGVSAPEERLASYPHELSGGLRQRVMIAMALLCRPALVLADEPTTALDVTLQAQILELLRELQERHGTAVLFVSHDLGVVAGLAARTYVLYAGRVVEAGPTAELFARPAHPYTAALLASCPRLDGDPRRPLRSIAGQPPDPSAPPSGCAFEPRCTLATAGCATARPSLAALAHEPARAAACFESARALALAVPP
jgi:oligopeptide/dipeptide ABC transporter ATP-binding protein